MHNATAAGANLTEHFQTARHISSITAMRPARAVVFKVLHVQYNPLSVEALEQNVNGRIRRPKKIVIVLAILSQEMRRCFDQNNSYSFP